MNRYISVVLTALLELAALSGCTVVPPYVLNSDQSTCECYQEALYPETCPRMTPQLPEACDNITNYVYNSTQVEDFCSEPCLLSLDACYERNPMNCTAGIFAYYNLSFCSRDESGNFCVSLGVSLMKDIAELIGINRCADSDNYCPTPPATCGGVVGRLCKTGLVSAIDQLGCCAASLFDDPYSPFLDYTVTNVGTYSNCDVSLGAKCPYVAPLPRPEDPSLPGISSTSQFPLSPKPVTSSPSVQMHQVSTSLTFSYAFSRFVSSTHIASEDLSLPGNSSASNSQFLPKTPVSSTTSVKKSKLSSSISWSDISSSRLMSSALVASSNLLTTPIPSRFSINEPATDKAATSKFSALTALLLVSNVYLLQG